MRRRNRLHLAAAAIALLAALPLPGHAAPAPRPADAEHYCLSEALYWEARGEGVRGMLAVAMVILNRVEHPSFPGTICQVVHQARATKRCQFSYWCDGKSDKPTNGGAWRRATAVATEVLSRTRPLDITSGALYFHATYVKARWISKRERTAKIGKHIYYR